MAGDLPPCHPAYRLDCVVTHEIHVSFTGIFPPVFGCHIFLLLGMSVDHQYPFHCVLFFCSRHMPIPFQSFRFYLLDTAHISATLVISLIYSFLILSFFVTPHIHLNILISFVVYPCFLPFCCCPCLCSVQYCWSDYCFTDYPLQHHCIFSNFSILTLDI